MQLYNTKVVPAAGDALWQLPEPLPAMAQAALLVLSAPYAAGSAEEQTLVKMMAACKLHGPQYVVMQLAPDEQIGWQTLAAAGAPRKILMLGIAPAQLAIHALFRVNYCNSFLGCTFIPGYTLAQIGQNAAVKRELWEQGLKPCFGL